MRLVPWMFTDEIDWSKSIYLFSEGIKYRNNFVLAKLAKRNIISFKASKYLTKYVA
jgi:hypothetical protein